MPMLPAAPPSSWRSRARNAAETLEQALGGMAEGTIYADRLEPGSIRHARRRADEMAAAGDLLDELGVPARITRASQGWLEQLTTESGPHAR
jgi:Domain of unknown function (DUF1932)